VQTHASENICRILDAESLFDLTPLCKGFRLHASEAFGRFYWVLLLGKDVLERATVCFGTWRNVGCNVMDVEWTPRGAAMHLHIRDVTQTFQCGCSGSQKHSI
jgi:hypothetical protein